MLLGCEVLRERPPRWLRQARIGLLANQASMTRDFEHLTDLIRRGGGRLSCLFSPQHGFHGEKQANMVESPDDWNGRWELPVVSLYKEVRQPTDEMLEHIDVLVVDLQDVGTRVYTYGITMGLCLEAAARAGVKVVVLDRPNPIDGKTMEGNILEEEFRSFVGRYPVPMRHGLTMGELARFIVMTAGLSCDMDVIPLAGWKRGDFFPETNLPWLFPSPNMPSWETALVYPGMVLLEGTNMSEGRGTTLPFQLFGAPFLEQEAITAFLARAGLEGVMLRPVCFQPVFDKWKGEMCRGFQIHVTDRKRFRPYRLGLALLQAFLHVHGERFQWLPPPYEYEYKKPPIDILLGNGALRSDLERGEDLDRLEVQWVEGLDIYRHKREPCLLYGD